MRKTEIKLFWSNYARDLLIRIITKKEVENFKLCPHRVDGSPYNLRE